MLPYVEVGNTFHSLVLVSWVQIRLYIRRLVSVATTLLGRVTFTLLGSGRLLAGLTASLTLG